MVVHFVRLHWSSPDVTISESKFLFDTQLKLNREVDVVIEGDFDGEPVVTSIEVVERSRPAGLPWVQEMIAKHRYLPTNRLVLVSKSGFTKTAIAAVDAEGGKVQAVTPEIVMVEGKPAIRSIWSDQIQMTPTMCRLQVFRPDGKLLLVNVDLNHSVFDDKAIELGNVYELVTETLNLPWVGRYFLTHAHDHPRHFDLKGFNFGFPINQLGYFLRDDELAELHRITQIHIDGTFTFEQTEVALTMAHLSDKPFASGESNFFGKPAVWVSTSDDSSQKMMISVRTKDGSPFAPISSTILSSSPHFVGLSELAPPAMEEVPFFSDGILQLPKP